MHHGRKPADSAGYGRDDRSLSCSQHTDMALSVTRFKVVGVVLREHSPRSKAMKRTADPMALMTMQNSPTCKYACIPHVLPRARLFHSSMIPSKEAALQISAVCEHR